MREKHQAMIGSNLTTSLAALGMGLIISAYWLLRFPTRPRMVVLTLIGIFLGMTIAVVYMLFGVQELPAALVTRLIRSILLLFIGSVLGALLALLINRRCGRGKG
jgi:predicted membrane-bound spermidine synthase